MSVANVLKLDEYRDRRAQRLLRARALLGRDTTRLALFDHLGEVARLTGADRAAAVWIDETGQDLVHPHVIVDLVADRPRRIFSSDPLRRAWDLGIPGTWEGGSSGEGAPVGVLAIALGSDGARSWFLVCDSQVRRPRLDADRRQRLMFLAGECSALVLHRDLDDPEGSEDRRGFPGLPVLEDLEGYEWDEARCRVVETRFQVARLIRGFLEDDLAVPEPRRVEWAGRAREELERTGPGPEHALLLAALDAYEQGDASALASAASTLAESAEGLDHAEGALELYASAFEAAAGVGEVEVAIRAARFAGRVLRRRARWHEADGWYQVALDIARAANHRDLEARALAGLGLVRRERGNLPGARDRFLEALEVAQEAGDAETLASIHHDLMGLEHVSGDLHAALRHGWRAVNTYRTDTGRTRCMAGMAGVLRELGDWDAAHDAYTLVVGASSEHYYRVYAFDGLAYVAALKGDVDGFEHWAAECDRVGWERGPAAAKAEVLCFRGRSLGLLGRTVEARAWLERAVAFASEQGFGRTLFLAEASLAALSPSTERLEVERSSAPSEVRAGLRSMREALAEA
jgi:tetratricopeptide (TPR) repeat protein